MNFSFLIAFAILFAGKFNHTYAAETQQPPLEYKFSYDFGNVPLGYEKAVHWNLKAKTDLSLKIKSVTLNGENFKLSTNCPQILPPTQRCSVGASFTPTKAESSQGIIIVDLYSEIFIFNLTGAGILN